MRDVHRSVLMHRPSQSSMSVTLTLVFAEQVYSQYTLVVHSHSATELGRWLFALTLMPVADQRHKHPAHFGLGLAHPCFQRRKIRSIAGARHHPQQIFAG